MTDRLPPLARIAMQSLQDGSGTLEQAERGVLDALTADGWRPAADQQIAVAQRRIADLERELAAASDAVTRLEPDDDPEDDLELPQRITRLVQERAEAAVVRERDDLRGQLAEVAADLDAARAEVDRLRQALDDRDRAYDELAAETEAQPDRWQLPPEPAPHTTEVWGRSGHRWDRDQHGWTRDDDWHHHNWPDVLLVDGPLSAAPPETDPYDWPEEPPPGSVRWAEDGTRWERRVVDSGMEPYSWYGPSECLGWYQLARRNPSATPPETAGGEHA